MEINNFEKKLRNANKTIAFCIGNLQVACTCAEIFSSDGIFFQFLTGWPFANISLFTLFANIVFVFRFEFRQINKIAVAG